ncbi:MAG: hypothetical protein ACOZF0_07620 [Thermodesulfobacteriota bacterium]
MCKRIRFIHSSFLFLFLLGAASCTTTQLVSEYKDEAYKGRIQKILVVGVSDNLANRKLFEETFARELNSEGVTATASSAVIPADQKVTKDTLKAKALELGTDTVLVAHLLGVDEEEVYTPPTMQRVPAATSYGFGPYYTYVDNYVHYPGYYSQHVFVRLETNLYETATEKLIWSVSSEIMDPDDVAEVVDSLCRAVLKNLNKNNLL